MSAVINLDDVPLVSELELALPMKHLIESERSLCLLKGARIEDRRVVEDAFWDAFEGPTERGVAILIRFWCLVETFSTQRFKAMLLHRGYRLIGPAVAAASQMRLNAHWGFNPQKLLWGMRSMADMAPQSDPVGILSVPNQARSNVASPEYSQAA